MLRNLILISLLVVQYTSFEVSAKTTSNESNQILKDLKDGNQRYVTGKTRTTGQSQEDIKRLSNGQNPKSIVLSCSDSRVPPELVFDQKLGEMFTVRSAGQALSPQALGSMEFAVSQLGSKIILVLGHTQCGAVKAAIETPEGKSTGSNNLDELLKDLRPRIKVDGGIKAASENLKSESWSNVKGVAADLLKRSAIISKAVEEGKVQIVVGLYNLSNGKVEFE